MNPESEKIRFLDLAAQNLDLLEEFQSVLREVVTASSFALGPQVEAFETEFAEYIGSKFAIGVSTGTSAIEIALKSLGVGPGDEVIVPSLTFVATAEAVIRTGATPVFVDCDPDSWLIDLTAVPQAIGDRTRCVLPVHLHGNVVDIPALRRMIGDEIFIVEDCAQAHGASLNGTNAGNGGQAGCFSFYPGKNLGALGEAGAIVTDDETLRSTARLLRSWGETERYRHEIHGYNDRMDGLQAGFLRRKLLRLDQWDSARSEIVDHYFQSLSGTSGLQLPSRTNPDRRWHIFAVRVDNRNSVRNSLAASGVESAIHYPTIVPDQPAFAGSKSAGALDNSRAVASSLLSLPLHPALTISQVSRVVDVLQDSLT